MKQRPLPRPPWPLQALAWVLLAGAPALTLAADDERARLAQQRRQLGEAFAAEERSCAQRFAVTACVDEVRQRRREALAPVRERELQLDDAERQQRAAERRAAIEAKRAAAASAPSSASSSLAPAPQVRVRTAPAAASRPQARPREDAEERAAQAGQRQRQAQARRDEAEAAQQRVQRRQEERAASGRKAVPLPVPASAPRR